MAVASFDSLWVDCMCYLINNNVLQTLIENGLRERVILRVDGGFKSRSEERRVGKECQ